MTQVTKVVKTAKEYKEAINAAETLGLEVKDTVFSGSWEDNQGRSVFPRGRWDIDKVGHTYFHTMIDGEKTKVQSCNPSSDVLNEGAITVKFKANND